MTTVHTPTLERTNVFTGTDSFRVVDTVRIASQFATGGSGTSIDPWTSPTGTGGIQEAVNATPSGGKVFLPTGVYKITNTTTMLLPITIEGTGKGSVLAVDSAVTNTTDVLVVNPTSDGDWFKFSNFAVSKSGTPGRHNLYLNGATADIQHLEVDHVLFAQLNGNAIFADGSGAAQGVPVLVTIHDCYLIGGVVMSNAGDTVRIENNQITGNGPALDISFQAGASTLILRGNNITSLGGIHLGTQTVAAMIENNEIETFPAFTGSNGALIDVDHGDGVIIRGNSLQVVNGVTANGIRVNAANGTMIYGNRIGRGIGLSTDIVVTASATSTTIGTNYFAAGGPWTSILSNAAGSQTLVAADFSGSFLVGWPTNGQLASIDDAGTQRPIVGMNTDGTVTLYGLHGRTAIATAAGSTYLFDGNGPPGNITLATVANSAQPVAGTAVTVAAISGKEVAAITGAVGFDQLYPDSTAHRWKMNNNNGGADSVVGAATVDTLTNKTTTNLIETASISIGTNPAAVGAIRLANGAAIQARNAGNTADLNVVKSVGGTFQFGANSEIITNGGVDLADGVGTIKWRYTFATSELKTGSAGLYNFTSGGASAAADTGLSRGTGAGIVAIGNGTAGDVSGQLVLNQVTEQTANGAQWIHGQASELLTLSVAGTTTDTVGNLLPANSIIEAVVARVTTTITTATNWELGDATTAARFAAPNSTMTAGATSIGTVQADQTGAAGPRQTAAAKVRVTTTGTPGAGVIRITVFYRQFVAPTS